MKKLKLGKYKVLVYAAAILLVGAGVLFTSVTVAQGAEQSRVVAEQSGNTGLALMAEAVTPGPVATSSTTPGPVVTSSTTPGPVATSSATPEPQPTSNCIPGPECITESEAKDAYIWVAKEIFGMKKVDKNKLTAHFIGADQYTRECWYVTSRDTECTIDAISGDVLMFSVNYDKKYTGKKITLGDFEADPFSNYIRDNPNNAYSKLAAGIVNSKLANGRIIDEIMIDGIQFVWDKDSDGFDPKAKGTIQVDAKVLMPSGRSYCLSFWGTKQLELRIFTSHPTKDACLWGYFYEEQAGEYSPTPSSSSWETAPGITPGPAATSGN